MGCKLKHWSSFFLSEQARVQFPLQNKNPSVQHVRERASGRCPSVSSTVCCPRSLLILSVALENQAGHCHQGFVVSSWRSAFPGSSHAPPASSCCPQSSRKSKPDPSNPPLPLPPFLFSHHQEMKLWTSFRCSSLRRQNLNMPPPKSLGVALWAHPEKDICS